MFLKKIYTEPFPIFEPVEFRNGMNFIYGKKEVLNPKNSLNSIGKSTFLDLIDFCLLASYNKSHNPRLVASKKVIGDLTVVLEFSINEVDYLIKRNLDKPSIVEFGTIGETQTYKEKELKIKLGNLIFKQSDYPGEFNSSWYRNLISFFLKIQKHKKEQFVDPIRYIREIGEEEINLYQLFFLDIDNSLSYDIYKCRTNQKSIKPSIKEIDRFVKEKYGLKDIKEAQNQANKLKIEIRKLQKAIEKFKLGEQYVNAEEEANSLTKKIKEFLYQNHIDKSKIEAYEDSYTLPEQVSIKRITNIYKEISEDLAHKIKSTLEEAIDFRNSLSESRKEFIGNEIKRLKELIKNREIRISEFEEKRAKIFYFLSTKEAINDLTEAFFNLSEKQNNLNEIEGNTKLLIDLTNELSEIENELGKILINLTSFIDDVEEQITDFYEIITDVFDSIYIHRNESSSFSLTANKRKNSLLEIDLSMPDMFGKGKNQGRSLVYDISVLLLNIHKNRNIPRFLIHDGIFDGVDKAHFLAVWELVQKMSSEGKKFQYITTLNEEGTLSENFGNKDLLTPQQIEHQSILILTPNKKLLGKDF